ncbi:MAG: phosphotransferase family protein [Chloroflexota bacterium]|nr:phosphotransferase family protein [Chloroflexota bacterium]MDE2894988.1 phosphotransferase family protein [Chloroflexota bacterium]
MEIELTPALATEALQSCGVGGQAVWAERLDGGVSNLTWQIGRDDDLPVVLRLERKVGIFQPYDVRREARVMRCLEASPIPVPEVLGEQGADSPLGAPYVVLSWMPYPHMGMAPMTPAVTHNYRTMVQAIHSLDWRQYGLEFLDPPPAGHESALRDLDAVRARAVAFNCHHVHLIAEIGAILNQHLPDSPEARLCHGDINVFNYLVGEDGSIAGVVDWEQANLGDPLSDWGLITALASLKGLNAPPEDHPLAAPAFERSGRDAHDLRYWMLHQMYKLAVIHRIWSEIGDAPPWYSWADVERVSESALMYLGE